MKIVGYECTGRMLRQIRVLLGVSVKDIANEMKTTKQTISNIELEKSNNSMAIEFYTRVIHERIYKLEIKDHEKIIKIIKILFEES